MDYTKYNFDAIVGAEVEIGNQRKIFGKVVCSTDEAVVIQLTKDDNALRKGDAVFLVKGTILALTARIKVEDMSVKQLKRFIKPCRNWQEVVMIAEDGVHHSILEMCDEPTDDMPVKSFTDYIDCTEWGWR